MITFLESRIINERTGYFKALLPVNNFIKPIEFYIYSPVHFIKPYTIKGNSNLLSISGSGLSKKEAKEKCLGEALERYCWYYADYWLEQFYSSFDNLKDKAIPPKDFTLFANTQYAKKGFPFIPFSNSTHLDWVKGVRVKDQEPIYVPSQLCFPIKDGKIRMSYYTTTGLACSDNYDRTIYTAICEVIERDAFMLMWLNKLKPHLIEIDWQAPSKIKTILDFLAVSRSRYS
jgi:ribosomal protein S12 methylthiotransferase accessory factor